MKQSHTAIGWLLVLLFSAAPALAQGIGPGFTYQGRIDSNGLPINGAVHLRFSLWSAAGTGTPPTGGTQIGASQLISNVPVAGGQFVVMLNGGYEFGGTPFDGGARFIQIEVCADATCTSLTVLSPRQPVAAAPYAQTALKALSPDGNSLDARDGNPTNVVSVDNNGNVGIGTTTPTAPLHVYGTDSVTQRIETAGNTNSWAQLEFANLAGGWNIGTSRDYNGNQFYIFRKGQPANALTIQPDGEVYIDGSLGIGVFNSEDEGLRVKGDIAFGPNADLLPAQAPVVIVQGRVLSTGPKWDGYRFSSSVDGNNVYTVTFDTPYVFTPPTFIASCGDADVFVRYQVFKDHVNVWLNDKNGVKVRQDFAFIAVGERPAY